MTLMSKNSNRRARNPMKREGDEREETGSGTDKTDGGIFAYNDGSGNCA